MSNSSIVMNNGCPLPFLSASQYPSVGGNLAGRHCVPLAGGVTECCLPCPLQQWVYPDDFQSWLNAASYINLVSCACCVVLLLSFLILPVTATHRHYLSVSLVFAVLLMELGFVVPFQQGHHQCYNDITPNDMKTSNVCALSGAFLLGGGWCVVMWVFLRALSLHLQICWQVIPGKHFFIGSQIVGWSIPAAMLAVALSITGVSYRFGDTCHINTENGLASFWGPLLGFAAAAIVTQFVTFGYCLQVYLRSLFEEKQATDSASIPYSNSLMSVSYAQALRRIRRVVSLQWRGIMVVIVIIADVVFFATVFLQFDFTTSITPENIKAAMPWAMCLVETQGDKNACRHFASHLTVSEPTAIATLFLLSCNGFWVLILLGQTSIITGWIKFFKTKFRRSNDKEDFVSYSAARGPVSAPISAVRMYEELHSKTDSPDYQKTDFNHVPSTREINTKPPRGSDYNSYQSFEMSRSPQSDRPIINRDSFRPVSRKRASSERNFSVNFNLPPKSPRISEDPEMGYGIAVTTPEEPLPERPRFQRSVTSPTPALHSHSRSLSIGRTRSGNISPEQEALELSLASSLPRSRPYHHYNNGNGGIRYPSSVTRV